MIRFLVLGLLLSSKAFALITIELKPSVEIDGAYPYLTDLVAAEGPMDKVELISGVAIGRPVLPGRSVRYTKSDLERWIRNAGLEASELHWKGADRVTVFRRSGSLERNDVEDKICIELVSRFGIPPSALSVAIDEWRGIRVPANHYLLEVDIEQGRLQSDMSAVLSVLSGGRLLKKLRIRIAVELRGTAIVSAVDLASNTRVDPSLLTFATVNVLSANGDVFSSLDELAGYRLTRPLPAGRPLSRGDVEPIPAVVKSRGVDVIYSSGSISIEMKGVALEDGVVGDTVMVMLPTSDMPVPVTIIGQKRGRIENGV